MTVYKEFKVGGKGNNPLGSFGGVIALILFFVMLYFLAKGLFTLLSFIAPVLLLITLVIDHSVVLDYGKFIIKMLKNNILVGILAVLLTVIGFPVVTGFLFFRAMVRRKLRSIGQMPEAKKEDFVAYEEVVEEEDFLELPEIEKPKPTEENDYDDLFK